MMKLTEEILQKYADGQLSALDVLQVEKLLTDDKAGVEKLRLMQLSGVALKNIDVTQGEQDAVAELRGKIFGDRSEENRTGKSPTTDNVPGSEGDKISNNDNFKDSRGFGWDLTKVAAALVILLSGLVVGYYSGVGTLPQEDVRMAQLPVWMARVVDYHTLYDRETVEEARASAETIAGLEARFSDLLANRVTIPDLGALGLQFKRGQILKFENAEIIQLAYLPDGAGKPVALCFRAQAGVDFEPTYTTLRGLSVARWRDSGIEYILVGEQSDAQTIAVTEQAMATIASG